MRLAPQLGAGRPGPPIQTKLYIPVRGIYVLSAMRFFIMASAKEIEMLLPAPTRDHLGKYPQHHLKCLEDVLGLSH